MVKSRRVKEEVGKKMHGNGKILEETAVMILKNLKRKG